MERPPPRKPPMRTPEERTRAFLDVMRNPNHILEHRLDAISSLRGRPDLTPDERKSVEIHRKSIAPQVEALGQVHYGGLTYHVVDGHPGRRPRRPAADGPARRSEGRMTLTPHQLAVMEAADRIAATGRRATDRRVAQVTGLHLMSVYYARRKLQAVGCWSEPGDYAGRGRRARTPRPRVRVDDAFRGRLRALHALGYTDPEAAAELGTHRHRIARVRKALGLAPNTYSPRRRLRVAARTAGQVAALGLPSLGALRAEVYRARARVSGWPGDLRFRHLEILDALHARGPMTRRGLAECLGMPWKGSRASLSSNDPEGSYLAHLVARGLVVSLGRCVRGRGRGRSVQLYTLALGAEKGVGS